MVTLGGLALLDSSRLFTHFVHAYSVLGDFAKCLGYHFWEGTSRRYVVSCLLFTYFYTFFLLINWLTWIATFLLLSLYYHSLLSYLLISTACQTLQGT